MASQSRTPVVLLVMLAMLLPGTGYADRVLGSQKQLLFDGTLLVDSTVNSSNEDQALLDAAGRIFKNACAISDFLMQNVKSGIGYTEFVSSAPNMQKAYQHTPPSELALLLVEGIPLLKRMEETRQFEAFLEKNASRIKSSIAYSETQAANNDSAPSKFYYRASFSLVDSQLICSRKISK